METPNGGGAAAFCVPVAERALIIEQGRRDRAKAVGVVVAAGTNIVAYIRSTSAPNPASRCRRLTISSRVVETAQPDDRLAAASWALPTDSPRQEESRMACLRSSFTVAAGDSCRGAALSAAVRKIYSCGVTQGRCRRCSMSRLMRDDDQEGLSARPLLGSSCAA